MNSDMRAVGFSGFTEKPQLENLIRSVTNNPDKQYVLGKNDSDTHVEYMKSYGENFGLLVRGIINEKESVTITSSQPYFLSAADTECSYVETEPCNGEYLVIGEELETGIELVFRLQNVLDLLDGTDRRPPNKINIGGLSTNGTVILPVAKDEYSEQMCRDEDRVYKDLLRKARMGDESAKQTLEIQEQETTELMRERLQTEDLLTVVEGFFIAMDNDDTMYSILGDIEDVKLLHNDSTEEEIYRLRLNVTGARLELCVNSLDLTGMPSPGMRFMGNCRLQGRIVY